MTNKFKDISTKDLQATHAFFSAREDNGMDRAESLIEDELNRRVRVRLAEELTGRLQSASLHDHYFEVRTHPYTITLHHDKSIHAIQTFNTQAEVEAFIEGVWFGKDRA